MAKKTSLAEMIRSAPRTQQGGPRAWHDVLADKDPALLAEIHEAIDQLGKMLDAGEHMSYAQAARLIVKQARLPVRPVAVAQYISRRLNAK